MVRPNVYVMTAVISAGSALALGGLHAYAQAQTVSTHGSYAFFGIDLIIGMPIVFGLLATPAIIGIAGLAILMGKARKEAGVALVAVLGFWPIWFGITWGGGHDVREAAFAKLVMRSTPLVDAIKRYTADNGQPPAALSDLVPAYLSAVPGTGMGAYPTFSYERPGPSGQAWALFVECPSGGINFDRFAYHPDGNYAYYGSWGTVHRVGEWAYVHE